VDLKDFLSATYPPPKSRSLHTKSLLSNTVSSIPHGKSGSLPKIGKGTPLEPAQLHYEADPPDEWVLRIYAKESGGLEYAPTRAEVQSCRKACLESADFRAVAHFPLQGGFSPKLHGNQKPKQAAIKVYEQLKHEEYIAYLTKDDSSVVGGLLSSATRERKRYFRTGGVFWWTPATETYVPKSMDEGPGGEKKWVIEESSWRLRSKENDGKAYFDSDLVVKQGFSLDWQRMSLNETKFEKLCEQLGCEKKKERDDLKKRAGKVYPLMLRMYDWYCSKTGGNGFQIKKLSWFVFLEEMEFLEKGDALSKRAFEKMFIQINKVGYFARPCTYSDTNLHAPFRSPPPPNRSRVAATAKKTKLTRTVRWCGMKCLKLSYVSRTRSG
jgi:hypothetical protein